MHYVYILASQRNGTIYVGMPNEIDTARAVTVFGMTGLTRAWKWRGRKWME